MFLLTLTIFIPFTPFMFSFPCFLCGFVALREARFYSRARQNTVAASSSASAIQAEN